MESTFASCLKRRGARSLLLVRARKVLFSAVATMALCAAQDSGVARQEKGGAANVSGKHFAIAYVASSPTDKTVTISKKQTGVLQSIGEGLAKKLTRQGLVRVGKLDLQCCTVQLTLLELGTEGKASRAKQAMVAVRVAALDIDAQPAYSKEFHRQAATTDEAVKELVAAALADEQFLQALSRH